MTAAQQVAFAFGYFLLFTFAVGAHSTAPWVRTKKTQRALLLDTLPLQPGAKVYDLGCGDGVLLFNLALRHPGATFVGFEIAFLPYALGVIKKALGGAKYRNVHFKFRDFFGQHFADADVVILFLTPGAYAKTVPKLAAEVRDESVIVAEVWPFPNVAVERTVKAEGLLPMYFYRGRALREAAKA